MREFEKGSEVFRMGLRNWRVFGVIERLSALMLDPLREVILHTNID